MPPFGPLLLGTLLRRPYVFAFLITFVWAATRDLGPLRMLGFLAWGFAVAFAAEYASTRVGVPFGLYHYTGATRGTELYLSNVPFFDSLSFPVPRLCLLLPRTEGPRAGRSAGGSSCSAGS